MAIKFKSTNHCRNEHIDRYRVQNKLAVDSPRDETKSPFWRGSPSFNKVRAVNDDERLALALTMIELGDDVVDFGTTARILVNTNRENKNLFNQVMAKHLEGTGYTCRKDKMAYGNHTKTKKFHNLLQLQQQLQLGKTCIDQKT
jgi:hypothetical protein